MRLLLLLLFTAVTAFLPLPLLAQGADSGIYQVTDVGVDVTADGAAHARNQAVKQAQRTAFEQLLQRLDSDTAIAAKLSDDDIATLVQNFEVQNEHSSTVRYIGTFTVQFRPGAVRKYLDSQNAAYTDTASKPVLVLPVTMTAGHPILWEETTPWRKAWDDSARSGGLVPVAVPTGGLDDIAVLSTDETMRGKSESIEAMINKYQAGSAVVAVLSGDLSKPGSALTIQLHRYDSDGHSVSDASVILSVPADKKDADTILPQAVKQVRTQLEADWKQAARGESPAASGKDSGTGATPTTPAGGPTAHLPVNVPVATLADWEQIRQKLDHVSGITRAEVVTLARGMSSIELEFNGDIPQLQAALAAQNLSLTQDSASGPWTLQPATAPASGTSPAPTIITGPSHASP